MTPEQREREARLLDVVRSLGSVVVCFSGGIDSTLLVAAAVRTLGDKALAITAVSPSLPPGEREATARIANVLGVRHKHVETHEIDDPNYAKNDADRCFFCKNELYTVASAVKAAERFAHVASGIIVDDFGDHRPGIDAARTHGVRFPLAEAGFTKADVRAVARAWGLAEWDKPASACLSSRIPYGMPVTRERLARIGGLESEIIALGVRTVRVRYHETTDGDRLARIEADEADFNVLWQHRFEVADAARRHGFDHATVDLRGYRRGSQNERLAKRALRVLAR